jgi:glycosyltransferase involved in cell wall biosynthesis
VKILFLGPLPPPVNGHALAAKVFLDGLKTRHEVEVVDLSVDSKGDGSVSTGRIKAVLQVLREVLRKRRGNHAIYLTIAESLAGNFKDLLIYCLCRRDLARTYIHLHGGSIESELFDRYPVVRRINAAFIRRMAGVIISGKSHLGVFAGMIAADRIHISANFAEDEMFVEEAVITEKFANTQQLRMLFISNMIPMKGFSELADAWLSLPLDYRERLHLDFAGRFDSDENRERFVAKISGVEHIRYHGIVDGARKRELFSRAHVFCLPSAFKEGQPISILEAYASGCAVVTTGQPGIRDVFTVGVNGFEVEPRSVVSIVERLRKLVEDPGGLSAIAMRNRRTAGELYRTTSYNGRLMNILESVPGADRVP